MSETESNLSPADREMERALAGLSPAAAEIDLCGLAFEAGQRSAGRRLAGWRAAATLLAVGMLTVALMRPEPHTVDRIVTVTVEVPATAPQSSWPEQFARSERTFAAPVYFSLRNAVLERGLDALPEPSFSSSPARPDVIRASDIYRIGEQL
jgi:hypothetical protein